jgi:hypothetical protein
MRKLDYNCVANIFSDNGCVLLDKTYLGNILCCIDVCAEKRPRYPWLIFKKIIFAKETHTTVVILKCGSQKRRVHALNLTFL